MLKIIRNLGQKSRKKKRFTFWPFGQNDNMTSFLLFQSYYLGLLYEKNNLSGYLKASSKTDLKYSADSFHILFCEV